MFLQDGKTEYKSTTVADDATAEEFMDFYLDDPSRHTWVSSIPSHSLFLICNWLGTGSTNQISGCCLFTLLWSNWCDLLIYTSLHSSICWAGLTGAVSVHLCEAGMLQCRGHVPAIMDIFICDL